jgi:Na+/proline symporter/nitrogen-specific signal transduction histidine kinase
MTSNWGLFILISAYFILLFYIAYLVNRRREQGQSLINSATVYSLSMAVYCSAWTFYGSVGRAANNGISFLPIYLGPTLMMLLMGFVLKKIIRISKLLSITSIADFIASRYGQSSILAGMVAVIAVFGIVPYIALQLKAIYLTLQLISQPPEIIFPQGWEFLAFAQDSTFYITIVMIIFSILFGVRNLDASERHEGLVAVIAFESIVKLLAFLTVGIFVVYFIHDGLGDIYTQASQNPELVKLWTFKTLQGSHEEWLFLTLLAMLAILLLPRQFQMSVVENINESHLKRAVWLFPLYMLIINFFVLPIALSGRLHGLELGASADTFVLTLPIISQNLFVTWVVFLGGFSAATGMIIVETVALSNMICNSLVMPLIVKLPLLPINENTNLNRTLLFIRRISVVFVLFASFIYFRTTGKGFSLVSTGLISFLAVAQFAPSLIGGMYWKNGTRIGAIASISIGFVIWAYTLPFHDLIEIGFFPYSILSHGPFGISLLRPYQLFGLSTMSPIAHATFWSLLLNTITYVGVSLFSKQSLREKTQASLFVDVMRYSIDQSHSQLWRGTTTTRELTNLLERFLGKKKTKKKLEEFARIHSLDPDAPQASSELVSYTEKLLSGSIGSVSARIMVASVVDEEPVKMEEIMDILDATQHVISYSQRLEEKSTELKKATDELRETNLRLKELDSLKDDFISMITHELKTPLTSIRAFTEIMHDNLDISEEKRKQFLSLMITESSRLTRLINQVLDSGKMESGKVEWNRKKVSLNLIINEAVSSISQLVEDKGINLRTVLEESNIHIYADRDKIMQVMVNLLSNAVKFCPEQNGQIRVKTNKGDDKVEVLVTDNGIGVEPENRLTVFEKFRQQHTEHENKFHGTGLGLSICKKIIEEHNGQIGVADTTGVGAMFYFVMPLYSRDRI